MLLKKKLIVASLLVAVVVVSAFSCLAVFKEPVGSKEDMNLLRSDSTTQSYTALVKAVQSRSISDQGFRFIVLGDSRGNADVAKSVFRQAAQEQPAFIIHTGDMVYDGTVEQYLSYHLPLIKEIVTVPVIPVPGNHEEGPTHDYAGFRAIYGADKFSFVYGDCVFVGVNNADGLSDADLEFIECELSMPHVKRKFVFMHIPPMFVEAEAKGNESTREYRGFIWNAAALRDLMTRKQVDGVFFGHDHGYASHVIDGVRYTITAGAGAKFKSDVDWVEKLHHYIVVHVKPESVSQELVRMKD